MVLSGSLTAYGQAAMAAPEPPPAPASTAQEDNGPGPTAPPEAPYEAAEDAAPADPSGPDNPEPVELPELRSQYSTTSEDPVSGQLTTAFSAESVNFQDEAGDWVPVDNTLIPDEDSDEGWQNEANRFAVELPADLAESPVSLSDAADPGRSISLQLLDPADPEASAAVEVADAEAVYADAAGSGVDLAYEVQGDGVKESITLDSAEAAAGLPGGSISFALAPGGGMTPVLTGSVVTVVDGAGKPVFVLPAPFMDDAAGAHSDAVAVTLTESAAEGGDGQWTLTLTPDAGWLAAPERVYPVVVDPTITYPASMTGCTLTSTAPTAVDCSGNLDVSANTTGATQRVVMRFNTLLDVVPADAMITRARLNVFVPALSGAVPTSVDVREVTSSWSSGATWNTRTGSTAWTTPGGDRAGLVSARATLNPNASYQGLEIGELVQRWVDGSAAHNGLILEKTTPAAGGQPLQIGMTNTGATPELLVEWSPRTGARAGNESAIDLDVTDRTSVSVNPATGNAMVRTTEYNIAGVGLDLQVAHTSNSLSTAGLSPIGYGWTTSAGGFGGTSLAVSSYAVRYTDGNGANYVFHKAVDGTWTRPMGLDADLVANANGTFTLTERQSKVAQTFTDIGGGVHGLSTVTDRNGNTITYTYEATATLPYGNGARVLKSITDTRGRVLTLSFSGYWNYQSTDVANRRTYYDISANELQVFSDTADGEVAYGYDAAHRVTSITPPEGAKTTLGYDSTGRVTTLTRVANPANGTGPTWTFSYGTYDRSTGVPATQTQVTDPNGHTSTYTSDGRGRVSKVVDARGKTRTASYTPNDNVASVTAATAAPGGGAATTTSTYNGGSFTLASTTSPTGAGGAATYGTGARLYDVASSTDAKGNQTSYTYNTNGEAASVTRGGTTTRYLYQGDTDPTYGGVVNCGPTVGSAVTATKTGALCEERDALYTAGASAAVTTAHRTAYRYDTLGQLTTLIPPGTNPAGTTTTGRGVQTFTYDVLSRPQTTVDGNGHWTYTGYDTLDRRVFVQHNDDSTESYYVTAGGWLRSLAEYNPTGTQTRYTAYNRNPQLLERVQQIQAPEGTIGMDYDTLGLLTGYSDTGGAVSYGYNDANALTSITEPGGTCTGQTWTAPGAASTKCILINVDDDGRRTGIRYPGGATQTWTLDASGRPARITGVAAGTTRLDLTLSRVDPTIAATTTNPNKDTSLITSITDAVTSRKTAYSYDALDRLTVAKTTTLTGTSTVDWEAFCYDAAGNRTRYYTFANTTCTAAATPAQTLTYDGANQLTAATATGFTGSAFSYDGNGNQTAAKSTPGRTTTYNDRDQAITTTPTGGAAVTSAYAATGNAERVTAGTTTFQPSPLSPAPAWSASAGSATWAVRDPAGALIAIRQGSTATPAAATSYYPFTDQVGAVRTMVTTTGTVAATYTYSAYGVTKTATGPIAATNPYRYGQGYTDTTTGLIKLGARYYDPTVGRFTQVDPSGQEANEYAYAGGNPVSNADGSGLLYYVTAPAGYDGDGCTWSPDSYRAANFYGPCARHDICYGTSTAQIICDNRLETALRVNCQYAYPTSSYYDRGHRSDCYATANTYWRFVRSFGAAFR